MSMSKCYPLLGCGVDDALSGATGWVAGGAIEELNKWVADSVTGVMRSLRGLGDAVSPQFEAPWASEQYRFVTGVAVGLLVLFAMLAVASAPLRGDGFKSASVTVVLGIPVALMAISAAPAIATLLLSWTDAVSAAAVGKEMEGLSTINSSIVQAVGVRGPDMGFIDFVALVVLLLAQVAVVVMLLVRSAAASILMMFVPVAFAAYLFPPLRAGAQKTIGTLVLLIFAKPVMMLTLSLGASIAASVITTTDGAAVGTTATVTTAVLDHSFATLLVGCVVYGLAAFSPLSILRMVPIVAGAAESLGATKQGMSSAGAAARKPFDIAAGAVMAVALPAAGAMMGSALRGQSSGGGGGGGGQKTSTDPAKTGPNIQAPNGPSGSTSSSDTGPSPAPNDTAPSGEPSKTDDARRRSPGNEPVFTTPPGGQSESTDRPKSVPHGGGPTVGNEPAPTVGNEPSPTAGPSASGQVGGQRVASDDSQGPSTRRSSQARPVFAVPPDGKPEPASPVRPSDRDVAGAKKWGE